MFSPFFAARMCTHHAHLTNSFHSPLIGKRVYTLKKVVDSKMTLSAHPARFSPDDKMSRQRVTLKKRFNLIPVKGSAPSQ